MITHEKKTKLRKRAENIRPQQKKSHTSHPASKASLKRAREIECLATDSDILIWESQQEAKPIALSFFRVAAMEALERGVSF